MLYHARLLNKKSEDEQANTLKRVEKEIDEELMVWQNEMEKALKKQVDINNAFNAIIFARLDNIEEALDHIQTGRNTFDKLENLEKVIDQMLSTQCSSIQSALYSRPDHTYTLQNINNILANIIAYQQGLNQKVHSVIGKEDDIARSLSNVDGINSLVSNIKSIQGKFDRKISNVLDKQNYLLSHK